MSENVTQVVITRDDLSNNDISKIEEAIKTIIEQAKQSVCNAALSENNVDAMRDVLSEISLVMPISVYPEAQGHDESANTWAWHLVEKIPYSLALMHSTSWTLVGILCLGHVESEQLGGAMPNLASKQSARFLEIVSGAFGKFCETFGSLNHAKVSEFRASGINIDKLNDEERTAFTLRFYRLDCPLGLVFHERWSFLRKTFFEWADLLGATKKSGSFISRIFGKLKGPESS